MVATVPYFTLNDGSKIPALGMGSYMGGPADGPKVYEMVKEGIKAGYRHFDTAALYGSEEALGRAIRDSGIPRSEFYICTKLWNDGHHKVAEALETSLKNIGVDYVDLYLMHWPQAIINGRVISENESPTFIETWKDMEKLLPSGKVKTIGISNFGLSLVQQLLGDCTIAPATNQVELHPCLPRDDLREYCASKGILLTAYSPLGAGQTMFLNDPAIAAVAARMNVLPAQVAISWGVQRGTIVVAKTESPERMKANISLVNLTDDEMVAISAIHKKPGMHRAMWIDFLKGQDGLFGWTFKQLGWNMVTDGIVPN